MKKSSVVVLSIAMILIIALNSACSKAGANVKTNTIINMELTADYDTQDPFINEQLFYVTEDIETLEFDVSFELRGASGLLEIGDNESKEILWSSAWQEDTDTTQFMVTLSALNKEKEYVVRFTGTGIEYGKVVMTSTNSLVKERSKPQKNA